MRTWGVRQSVTKIGRSYDDETGIGLVEVLVAMMLLAIVALALLPILITGMKLAVSNTTIAAATQLANDRITAAQAAAPGCSAVVAAVNGTFDTTDKRGVPLAAATTVVGTCPAAANTTAATLKVTVVVTRSDTGKELASASTLVLVTKP